MNDAAKTFTLYANSGGCPQNQLDGAHVYRYLLAHGYSYTSSMMDADIIVLNSCAYRSEKEDQSIGAYHEACGKAKPGARIILTGCVPKIAPSRLSETGSNTTVIPGSEIERITQIVPPGTSPWEESSPNDIPAPVLRYVKKFRGTLSGALGALRRVLPRRAVLHVDWLLMYDHSPGTFIVNVARGCLGNCAYCAIRFSRGTLESKPVAAVIDEVRRGVAKGVPEILLSATDLAAYGRDIGADLALLLREVIAAAPTQDLLLFYANPRWLIDRWERLEPLFATGRIHFLHISVNGGSDNVLKRMRRGYALGEFETLVRAIKRASPSTVLQTQIITGFPGETDDDFQESVRFLKRVHFHNVQVHAFDPRPGTEAASMDGQVPPETRQRRRRRLYELTLRSKLRYDLLYAIRGFRPGKE